MIRQPFPSLLPFADRIDVRLFGREDALSDDAGLAHALGTSRFASLRQAHGHATIIMRESSFREEEADGIWTDVAGLTLSIRSADCQTFLAYDPNRNVLGVLHVGWRGLLNGAMREFFETARREWDIGPASLLVCAGPSLCVRCSAFSDPVRELPKIDARFFQGRHADLRGIADEQLRRCGIAHAHIDRHPACTRCDARHWYSYRAAPSEVKDGYLNVMTGRMAG